MRRVVLGVVVASVLGCVAQQRAHRADLNEMVIRSWQDVDLIVLERHPRFAHRTPEVRQLSDGTETWVYTRCRGVARSSAVVAPIGNAAVAGGSMEFRSDCCYSQFFIAPVPGGGKRVQEYRPVNCRLDCQVASGGCGPAQPYR